jgi:hypothetical protein
MIKDPIHENLSTSFVDLSALVDYLSGLQFVGSVRLEMSSYEADIIFCESGEKIVREIDHIAGISGRGGDSLKNILERARMPFGSITVYPSEPAERACYRAGSLLDEGISRRARAQLLGLADQWVGRYIPLIDLTGDDRTADGVELPPRPFALRIPHEDAGSFDDWGELLEVTGELLRTIEIALLRLNFDFASAFENACAFASSEMHFIDPETGFRYRNGVITIGEVVSTQAFVSGTMAALSHVFSRLREQSDLGNLLHPMLHSVRVYVNHRRASFEKFDIMDKLPVF